MCVCILGSFVDNCLHTQGLFFQRAHKYILYIWILFRVSKGGALLWYIHSALLCIRVLYTGLIVFIGLVYIYIYVYVDLVSCM